VLANTKRLAIRSVALTLDHLMEKESQLDLWEGRMESGRESRDAEVLQVAMQHAVDRIHARYGAGALRRGGPLTAHRSPLTSLSSQATTTLPKLALPSSTRCASAS
jgi:hypothetical protein